MEIVDQSERARAVHSTVNVLVEAGAGTGKTTLIMDRVIEALHQGIPLARILLITFMDKAQEEMRSRLMAKLDAHDFSGTQGNANPLDASITTIHGFCRRVLVEFGARFGIPLDFRVLDTVETERLWLEAFTNWVAHCEQEQVILQLLHAGIQWSQLVSWGRAISRWTRVPNAEGDFPHLAEFLTRYTEEVREYVERAEQDAEPDDGGLQQIRAIGRQLQFTVRMGQEEWPRMLAQWTEGLSPKGNKKHWNHPDWLTEQKAWVQNLREDLAALREKMSDAYLSQWVNLMRESFLPYWRHFRFDMLALTYDDLLVEAERVTRDRTVREILSRRYDLVMVDEFQDTDALQATIIRRLVTSTDIDTLSSKDQGRLFLVGDPKQSIYRFRGADVEAYVTIREEIQQTGGQVIPIWQNFRSHPQILDVVNEIFSQKWPVQVDLQRPYIPPFQPLEEAFTRDELHRVTIEAAESEGSAREKRAGEACRVASVIARAIQEHWPVREGDGTRPITYGDIALIVPQRTAIDIYRQALVDYKIPVAAQSGREFFRQDEIRGLRHLFRALENPDDMTAVVGWLVSPWVALSYTELSRHRLMGGRWDYRYRSEGSPVVLRWWETLERWHDRFFYVEPETVLDWAIAESSLGLALKTLDDEAALANINLLRQLCRSLGDEWGMDTFSQWFSQQVDQEVPFEEAKVSSRDSEVTISTVHQAKGLEWPMVIVANWTARPVNLEPGIHYNARLNAVGLRQEPWISRDYPSIDHDHRVREAAEGDRLLYVALTRARDYLWFYNTFLPKTDRGHGEGSLKMSSLRCRDGYNGIERIQPSSGFEGGARGGLTP